MKVDAVRVLKKIESTNIEISGVTSITEAYEVMLDCATYVMVKTLHSGVERWRLLQGGEVKFASCSLCGELHTIESYAMKGNKYNRCRVARCKKCISKSKHGRRPKTTKLSKRKFETITKPFSDGETLKCCYCRRELKYTSWKSFEFHIEHFIPRADGGANDESNLLPCCSYCNLAKNSLDFFEWSKDYFSHNSILTPYQVQKRMVDYFKEYYDIDYSDRINVPAD